jgi:predicted ATP-dependent endonuclease of OLD family
LEHRLARGRRGIKSLLVKEQTDALFMKALENAELFLLDEPETHLNPDWRASYISTLPGFPHCRYQFNRLIVL